MINALQHSYKSGFTQSLFMQFALHNKPIVDDANKKPLLVYISFEDDSEVFTEFMYRYLYYNENESLPDLGEVTGKDIAGYIKKRLSVNGYHIKMLRVDGNQWTYKDVFNKMLQYEAEGFEIHACLIDYVAKMSIPKELNNGPFGFGLREVFTRMRNFFSSKRILLGTPHQLSSQAKQLKKAGIKGMEFLDEVAQKGYLDTSSVLDQVVDMEIYLDKFTINRKWVLGVKRGKDRQPGILDDDKMSFILPFPKGAPIKENVNDAGSDKLDPMDLMKSDDGKFDF